MMKRTWVLCLVAAAMCTWAGAAEDAADGPGPGLCRRQTLTDSWFGLGEQLEARGVCLSLSLTQVYQVNVRGGLATHRHAGRWPGSYDLEAELDLEKLIGLPGGSMFVLAEGSWSEGPDALSVGSVLGTNDDAGGDRSIDVTELWYQQVLFGGLLQVRLGKIDLTGGFECRGCPVAFDANAFANDETAQFLSSALVNNPTIPFPDNGLGIAAYLEPLPWFYVAAGVADAQADARETGLRTAFHGEDHFFAIFETGVTPHLPSRTCHLAGAYRVGLWYDGQPKERFAGGSPRRDDVGFYVSLDQAVLKENADADDAQGLGLFARYGYAHDDVNEIDCFWSVGGQYRGLLAGRDDDVLGLGFARGGLVREAGFDKSGESILEVYYSARLAGWLNVTPSVQYVWSPGGADGVANACALGIRVQMAF